MCTPTPYADPKGKPIKCKAAVAWAANEPLKVETINVAPPRAGEVRLKVVANALCHTDVYTLTGQDPEGVCVVCVRCLRIMCACLRGCCLYLYTHVCGVCVSDHMCADVSSR